jgi:hypothetical protein
MANKHLILPAFIHLGLHIDGGVAGDSVSHGAAF